MPPCGAVHRTVEPLSGSSSHNVVQRCILSNENVQQCAAMVLCVGNNALAECRAPKHSHARC